MRPEGKDRQPVWTTKIICSSPITWYDAPHCRLRHLVKYSRHMHRQVLCRPETAYSRFVFYLQKEKEKHLINITNYLLYDSTLAGFKNKFYEQIYEHKWIRLRKF